MQTYDPVYDEQNPQKKQEYWETAFGLQAVDNLKPSKYMVDLAYEHIRGEKSYGDVSQEITKYHSSLNDISAEKEADMVSGAIYDILNDKSFRFDYNTYKSYHKKLFQNLDDSIFHPGEFRIVNLTKKEPILDGDTVQYQDYGMVEDSLKYDFNEEASQNYLEMTDAEKVSRIAEFTSRIWQIHPFTEGDTRTTAVFIQKYLQNMGFGINNKMFIDNSLYFRNALVRANYTNYPKNIAPDQTFLEKFFENLMFDKDNKLDNNELTI